MLGDVVLPASISLPKAANESMSFVLEGMKSVCIVHDVQFTDSVETNEEVASEFLGK